MTQEFQTIWHLPQSPNPNLMKYLWNEVNCCMRISEKKSINKKVLEEKLQEIWYSIEVHTVRKLIMSMPQRIIDVYQVKGGYTRW